MPTRDPQCAGAPREEQNEVMHVVERMMTTAGKLNVAFVVDFKE